MIARLPVLATLLVAALFLACVPGGWAAATVSVLSPPSSAAPGQTLPIQVQYTRSSDEIEKRVVVILELRRASDNSVVQKLVNDNASAGHTEASKTLTFQVTIPAGASGPHYFAAFASPWSLNKYFVQNYMTYPRDGTWKYNWASGSYGVTQNCYYLGTLICPKPTSPETINTTYCSGVAFEAFLLPYNAYNTTYGHARIGNITNGSQMETFRRLWYGVTDAERLSVRAIVDYNLGVQITDWEEAQDGDFCQFWRMPNSSGNISGHNPVFANWVRNTSGQITGFRYWGSQGSSNGIGFNTEQFGTTTSRVNKDRFYLGRVRKPRDQADYTWALGQASTAAQPTQVGTTSGVDDWRAYE